MSVLIKGMEMPHNCYECRLEYDCMMCAVTGTSFIWAGEFRTTRKNFNPKTDRLSDCPLVEIPTPHGQLIDADPLLKLVSDRIKHWDAPCSGDEVVRNELASVMWEIRKQMKEVKG